MPLMSTAALNTERFDAIDREIEEGHITSWAILREIEEARIFSQMGEDAEFHKKMRKIEKLLLDPPTNFFFLQHGMKGSAAGIQYYDVSVAGGDYLGWVKKYKTGWRFGIGDYGKKSPLFKSRNSAAEALKDEYALRRPDRPSYYAECKDKCSNGCKTCWAGRSV